MGICRYCGKHINKKRRTRCFECMNKYPYKSSAKENEPFNRKELIKREK